VHRLVQDDRTHVADGETGESVPTPDAETRVGVRSSLDCDYSAPWIVRYQGIPVFVLELFVEPIRAATATGAAVARPGVP
jgi:hypothetical protein